MAEKNEFDDLPDEVRQAYEAVLRAQSFNLAGFAERLIMKGRELGEVYALLGALASEAVVSAVVFSAVNKRVDVSTSDLVEAMLDGVTKMVREAGPLLDERVAMAVAMERCTASNSPAVPATIQ